jgi:signal transduction histidine kinase
VPNHRASAGRRDQVVFSRARLQLTACYALTLAMIVLIFSGVLYGVLSARLGGYRHEQELPSERRVERETTAFALGELRAYLLLGNVALLALGVGGAYWLAGRTLQPIARAMARQDRFTSDASHELRTPLTSIRSAIDVTLQRARSPAAYRAVLKEVNEEVEGMTALIEQLLWLARGGPPTRPETIDLRAILDAVVRKTAALAAERGSTVHLEPSSALIITVDPTALRLVLLNLVSNALQHTPSGTAVRICAERAGTGIALRISDNGPGIPEEKRANVFQPFYRLRTTGSDGHGLGLALAQELLTAAGGTIQIGETPGGGSTVSVWLPQAVADRDLPPSRS